MNRIAASVLWVSLAANVLLMGVGLWAVSRLGGCQAVRYRLAHRGLSGVYENKKSIFESLKHTEKDIIWIGDSMIELGRWSEWFGDLRHKNRGISGDYVAGVTDRLSPLLKSRPGAIFLMVGINDLMMGRSPEDVLDDYRRLVQVVRTQSPHTRLFVQSLLPVNSEQWTWPDRQAEIRAVNRGLRQLANKHGAIFVDLYGLFVDDAGQLDARYTFDGIHLNGAAYVIWKNAVKAEVERL